MLSTPQRRIAIIGGGISGLAAAQRLTDQYPNAQVYIFESSPRLGGVIQTTHENGFAIEHAADSFIVSPELPWAGELCSQLDLDLEQTSEQHRRAMIVRDGKLHAIPEGLQLMTIHRIGSVLASPLLSWTGKLRVLAEPFVPKTKPGTEESLHAFATRRYGKEMFDRIIQPLVSGIYTADPKQLSMTAALPQFVALEQKFGSLRRSAKRRQRSADTTSSGARYGLFRTPRGGMQNLVDAIESRLSSVATVRKNISVMKVTSAGCSFDLHFESSQAKETFDGLIVATPVRHVAGLVQEILPPTATSTIESVSTAIICLGFRRDQIRRQLDAFGCVVPIIEQRKILAASFTSVKFPRRAPEDHVLIRVFVGGALQPEVLENDDAKLTDIALSELDGLLGVTGKPTYSKVIRWSEATPQYNLGHRDRVERMKQAIAKTAGFSLCGNAYSGIGVPQCVRSGWDAAEKVATDLRL